MPTTPSSQLAPNTPPGRRVWPGLAVAATALIYLWVCLPVYATLVEIWNTNPQYSHGFLVPLFAAYLLWARRDKAVFGSAPRAWLGWPVLALGFGLMLASGYFAFAYPERLAVVVILAGLVLVLGGLPAWRWAWPAVAFCLFMVPLPGRVDTLLAGPLQRLAVAVSANILQTLGFFAHPDGTVVVLTQTELEVVEACSGLRMLTAFVALATAVVFVIDRPLWQRVVIWLAAAPVALVSNVGRIVITGILYETAGREWGDRVFHDLAGWMMMPIGLVLFGGVVWATDRLVVRPAPRRAA